MRYSIADYLKHTAYCFKKADFVENVEDFWKKSRKNPQKFIEDITKIYSIKEALRRGYLTLKDISVAISKGTEGKIKVNPNMELAVV